MSIESRRKLYEVYTSASTLNAYKQTSTIYTLNRTSGISISTLTMTQDNLNPRFSEATHIGLTLDRTFSEGDKIKGDSEYRVLSVENDTPYSQLILVQL